MNELNPGYMNNIFKLRNIERLTREKYKLNLKIPKPSQATFGTKSLRSYGPKMWNALSCHIKTSENLNSLKAIIKCWEGNHCTSESANIQLQDNRLSRKQKYLTFDEI